MNIIKPKKLEKGATIGLLSVSGEIREFERIAKAQKYFENKGFKVVVSLTTCKKDRYFAGSDRDRVEALEAFFLDDNIDAIVCTRGGYGVIRILDKIDYNIIKNNPKIFVGYSDITALLAIVYKKTGLVTFHGAMANGDFGEDNVDLFTQNSFFKTLEGVENNLSYHIEEGLKLYNGGKCEGIIWGGNLATLASMAGTDFIPNEKFILFLEDLNEPVYKIDRMITQLLNIPEFKKNLAGLALGRFTKVDNEEYLDELFKELAVKLDIPIAGNFEISH